MAVRPQYARSTSAVTALPQHSRVNGYRVFDQLSTTTAYARQSSATLRVPGPAVPAPMPRQAPELTWPAPKRMGRRARKRTATLLERVASGVAGLGPVYTALLGHDAAAVRPRGQGILMVSMCSPNGCGVSFTSPIHSPTHSPNGTVLPPPSPPSPPPPPPSPEDPDGLPECVTAARQLGVFCAVASRPSRRTGSRFQ